VQRRGSAGSSIAARGGVIEDAKTPETRQRQIEKAVTSLRDGRT
jgi:hypothetical protein